MHRTPSRRTAAAASAAVLSAAALLLAGCTAPGSGGAGSSPAGEPKDGGTLVYASGDAEPTCLDPHVGGNYPQALVATQYLEQLVTLDADGNPVPWLADSWKVSDDGLTWDITVRSGVEFTDGTPLTSEAIAANVAHLQDPNTKSSTGYLALQKVQSVEIVDDSTARLHLSSPDSALLESFSQPWLAIESPTALKRSQDENCASPVGTGPFVVSQWNRQQSIELDRNDSYDSAPVDAEYTGPAHLEHIEWRFIPEAATRYAALASGEVDVIDNAQPDAIQQAEGNGSLVHLDAPRPGSSNRLELNSGQAPFDDEKVREAFIAAADVNPGIQSLFFGTAQRSYSPLSSVEPTAYSEPDLFDVDTDRANQLLDEAGWTARDSDGIRMKDGQRLTLRMPVSTNQSIPAEVSLFEQLQAAEKAVGFDIVLNQLDLSSWYGALAANEYELVSAPYTKVGPDVLRILYDSSGITPAPSGYFANHAKVDDPALDALLAQASATSDPAQRADLYQQAQKIVLEGYYILPLYDQQNHFLLRNDVEGVRTLAVSTPTFAEAWLDR